MAAALFTVAASQIPQVRDSLATVARVIPVYVAFPVIMAPVGQLATRTFGLDVAAGRALTFSGGPATPS